MYELEISKKNKRKETQLSKKSGFSYSGKPKNYMIKNEEENLVQAPVNKEKIERNKIVFLLV